MSKVKIPPRKISRKDVWIVVPIYNEEKYLLKVIKKLKKVTSNIILVDDGSSDLSLEIAHRHCSHVLEHQVNLGKGAAMKTGCDYAFLSLSAEAVIFFDSDDQHEASELEQFYLSFENGSQVVFGERTMDSRMPLMRIISNRLLSLFVYFLFGGYVPDIPSGFKAISKAAYKKIRWQASSYDVELEISARVISNGLKLNVVPIKTIYHDFDRGMTILDGLRIIFKIINLKLII